MRKVSPTAAYTKHVLTPSAPYLMVYTPFSVS